PKIFVVVALVSMFTLPIFGSLTAHAQFDVAARVTGAVVPKAVEAGTGWISDAITIIPGFIAANVILPLLSFVMALSGLLLNFAVDQTVVQMAQKFSGISAIDNTWTTVRDVANMFFIFVLLYTAIMTMLG